MRPRIFHFLLSLPALSVALKAQPVEFSFTPSIISGVFIGQIEADGAPAEAGSWIAAFGPDGHCAGAGGLISFNGLSYANLNIYGDDPNTADVDEGLLPGDFFTLKLYLPSSGDIVDHTFENAPVQLSGWINNNGAPIPGYDDQNAVYNFITTPPPLSYTAFSTEPGCHDSANGQISLMVSGGLPPLSYLWSTGAGESSVMGLAAGTYACTITDAAGMVLVTAPITLNAPPALAVETTTGIDSCEAGTGAATALVSGGTTPYAYAWSTGQSTAAIEQLEAGVYALTVSDANGCVTVASAGVSPSPAFSVSAILTVASCFGASDAGAILMVVGDGPFQYLWSNGSQEPELSAVPAGMYQFTVTDPYGCQVAEALQLQEPAPLLLSLESRPELNGNADGAATAAVSGGTPPYAYEWNDENMQQAMEATGLPSGEYTVTVTDTNGCTQTGTVTVGLATGAAEAHREKPLVEVFPNPATGNIAYLKVEGTAKSITGVQIRSLNGQHIARLAIQPGQRLQIWIGGLEAGTYLLEYPDLPALSPALLIKH